MLFSRLAVSKSPSLIPFATYLHNRLLSNSSMLSTGPTVTSSLGSVTSVNGAPVLMSFDVWCHTPSIVRAALLDPGGESTALKEWDLPEK